MLKSRTNTPVLLAAMALALGGAAPALADGGNDGSGGVQFTSTAVIYVKKGDRGQAVRLIQRKLGVAVDGVFGRHTLLAVKRFQRRHALVADGVVGPITRRALGLKRFARDSLIRSHVALPEALRRIAKCESGGDPTAVSKHGVYRGKYQFTRATWRDLGGSGDPAEASESLQDQLALRLYRKRGSDPWPACSKA